MINNKALLALIALTITSALYSASQYKPEQVELKESTGNYRNFVQWMKTVKSTQGGHGLKALIFDINPSISQDFADQMEQDLTEAAKNFPTFCNTGDDKKDMEEFSAFLTIVGAETSFMNNFPCTTEVGCPNCSACSYNSEGELCHEKPNLQYFGRGPLQLSWNFNYAEFSKYMFQGDSSVLIDNPDKVTSSNAMCWSSAIWFWQKEHNYGGWCMPEARWKPFGTCSEQCPEGPSGCENPTCSNKHWIPTNKASCHDAIHSGYGIGQVISIINGGYDCCPESAYEGAYGHTLYRVWWYIDIYNKWTTEYPMENLSNIELQQCPVGKSVNCGKMTTGQCYSACCRFN